MKFKHQIASTTLRTDMTPLVDVMLFLLLFFLLGSQFVYSAGIKVNIPRAQSGTVDPRSLVTVGISRDSELFFDNKHIDFNDLEKIMANIKKGKIAIVADERAPFGAVIKVWDMARLHQIDEITLRTKT